MSTAPNLKSHGEELRGVIKGSHHEAQGLIGLCLHTGIDYSLNPLAEVVLLEVLLD